MAREDFDQLRVPLYSPAVFNQPCFSDRILRLEVSDAIGHSTPASGGEFCMDTDACPVPAEEGAMAGAPAAASSPEVELHVSRGVLAQASRFFLKLFSSGLRESGGACDNVVTLKVAPHEKELMVELIRFCYERVVPPALSSADLLGLMPLADRLEVVLCVEMCCKRLYEETLTLEDSITFLSIAESLHHHPWVQTLLQDCGAWLDSSLWNFDKFKDSPHFLSMPLTAMTAYLKSEALVVQSEHTIFSALVLWGEGSFPDAPRRLSALSEVFPYVRYALLDAEFLRSQVLCRPEFDHPPLLRLVNTALLYNLSSKTVRHRLETEGLHGLNWYLDRKMNRSREQGLNYVAESPCLAVYSIPHAVARAQRRPHYTFTLSLRKVRLHSLQQGQAVRSNFTSIAGVVSLNVTVVRNKLHRRDTAGVYVMLSGPPVSQQHFHCWVAVEGWRRMLVRTNEDGANPLDMGWHDFFSRSWDEVLQSPDLFTDDCMIVRVEMGLII